MGTRMTAVLGLCCASAGVSAVEMTLDPRAVTEAIVIGQSAVAGGRARYHAAYRLPVARPPLDYVEVVTPFRRIVLAAEARARGGDRSFGQRQGLEMLEAPAHLALWLEFSFHPHNTYVAVPAYAVTLSGSGEARIQPRIVERLPRYGARVDGLPQLFPLPGGAVPGGSQPMLGGTVIAQFDGGLLNANGLYAVVVEEAGKELVRAPLDLAPLR
jgi:hypothetical protein